MFTPSRTGPCRDAHPAVPHPAGPSRIGAGEAVVIIVLVTLAGALTQRGIPQGQVLQLLATAGVLSVAVLRAWSLAPLRMARSALATASSA
ncbi:hypothetical protein [Streptomyces olivaceiscleroticus]|uniref:Uncharacterized protein n=1 Tax=Streptomyces olivaceiscleroticus TaxID=68245 RepID=A0ABN0ZME0_9ACTN